MAGLEDGMVCIKTHGKEAGRKAVIIDFDKKTGIATIIGPHVKKRKCNTNHLLPTGQKVKVKKTSTQKELAELLKVK